MTAGAQTGDKDYGIPSAHVKVLIDGYEKSGGYLPAREYYSREKCGEPVVLHEATPEVMASIGNAAYKDPRMQTHGSLIYGPHARGGAFRKDPSGKCR